MNHVFKAGLYTEFRIYLYLKSTSDGHIKGLDKSILASELKISQSTLSRSLKSLLAKNWMGYNAKKGIYHVRSFNTVLQIEGLKGRLGTWFDTSKFESLNEFIDSSVVSEIVRRKKVEHWRAQQKGSAFQLQMFFEISVRYFANYTGLSDMTAQRRLAKARQSSFLLFEKSKSVCLGKHGAAFKIGYPELSDAVFYKAGKYYLRQGTKFQTTLLFKKRRKCMA